MPSEWDDVLSALGLSPTAPEESPSAPNMGALGTSVPGVGYVPSTFGRSNLPAQYFGGLARNLSDLVTGPGDIASGVRSEGDWAPQMALNMLGSGTFAPAEDASLGSLALRSRKMNPFDAEDLSAGLDRAYGTGQPNARSFDIVNEQNAPVGRVWTSQYRPDQVFINYISGLDKKGIPTWAPNTLGTSDLRSLLQSFREQFPEASKIGGYRISGAREQAGKTGPAYAKLPVSSQ